MTYCKTKVLLVLALGASSDSFVKADDDCTTASSEKTDCGFMGIDQPTCESNGCCWVEQDGDPWCFYKSGVAFPTASPTAKPTSCFRLAPNATEPFTAAEVDTMRSYFLENIDIQGAGTVVAGFNNANAVGGSYYYHWARDGAKTMRALQETSPSSVDVDGYMASYTQWVVKSHDLADPNAMDVRIEPKFYLPDGPVFDQGWCRPQNDGPGLRAISLIQYATRLGASSETVVQYLWTGDDSKYHGGAIKYDLDWVVTGWATSTCDLWEELTSADFFWNRVTMKKALIDGAAFAALMGDDASGNAYSTAAAAINASLYAAHWSSDGGGFVYESTNRMKDGAVIVGFNDGYTEADGLYAPTSFAVAATVRNYNLEFCHEWSINAQDTANGVPGVLYGRYPGDTYAGGNPWVLSSAALANLFYRAASFAAANGLPSDPNALAAWADVFGEPLPNDAAAAAQVFLRAGDGVLLRVRHHVEADNFHLAEQIDRDTGVQKSALNLTWSYAETLSAMASRSKFVAAAL